MRSLTGPDPRVFEELHHPEISLVCQKRSLPEGTGDTLLRWAKHREVSRERILSPSSFDLAPFLKGLVGPVRDWMNIDVAQLIVRFAKISGARCVRVALGPIRSDRCRKFHVDYLDYRLICTYAGPGTEWVPEEGLNRAALANSPPCPIEANAAIVSNPALIQHAEVGDVLLMKGEKHGHGLGLVHRSPPVEEQNASRVVLVINTA